jgi:hypothetical protein
MANSSFFDLVSAMINDAQNNIRQLRQHADSPLESSTLRHAINDVLHAESLRLDMLRTVISEIPEP